MGGVDGWSFGLGFVSGIAFAILAAYVVKRIPLWWARASVFVALGLFLALAALVVHARTQGCEALCELLGAPVANSTPDTPIPPAPTLAAPKPTAAFRPVIEAPTPTPSGCAVVSGPGLACRSLP